MKDKSGEEKNVRINVLLDHRVVTINFFIEYTFEEGKNASDIVEELYHPHENKTLLWSIGKNEGSKLDFKDLSKEYLRKIKSMIPQEAKIPKKKELSVADEELARYYEPYAIEIINIYTKSLYGKLKDDNKQDILKILFWEKSTGFKTEVMERLFDDVSGRTDYFAYFSPESTLFISNRRDAPLERLEVISMLINIEVLLTQKLLLQLYDQIVNNNLREVREKRISPSRTVEFRNNVTKDMEELFDIRIKKYQRGRVITDIGRRILI